MKSKLATSIFALFLGWIGIHRFYLGHVGTGLIYLIFCWTLIPGIIALFEFFYFFSMDEDNFDRKYNKKRSRQNKRKPDPKPDYDELDKLYQLKEKGAITADEYQRKKEDVIGRF